MDFSNLVLPFSITKKSELILISKFCESRINKFDGFIRPAKIPYDEVEISLYDDLLFYKAHKKGKRCLSYTVIEKSTCYNLDKAWFGGYIDGDGSFSLNRAGSPSFCVSSTSYPTYNTIVKFLAGEKIEHQYYSILPAKNHLPNCKLRVHKICVNKTYDILKILDIVEPNLITKVKQASVMRTFCNSRVNRKGKK